MLTEALQRIADRRESLSREEARAVMTVPNATPTILKGQTETLASAFSAIVVYAQELIPGKVGAVSGLFLLGYGIARFTVASSAERSTRLSVRNSRPARTRRIAGR